MIPLNLPDELAKIRELVTRLSTPEEVLALRPSEALQERIGDLMEKSRRGTLSSGEQMEWQQYQSTEHLVRLAKAHAALKLRGE